MLERALPRAQVGRNDEVGEDEDERLRREIASVLGEEVQPERHGVRRCSERTGEGAGLGARLRTWRQPERLALREVEVAGEAACSTRARPDQVEHGEQRPRLVQRPDVRRGNRHRRPPVAEHDDAGRLVREALSDDELVGAARG